jgi:hypothetical protein
LTTTGPTWEDPRALAITVIDVMAQKPRHITYSNHQEMFLTKTTNFLRLSARDGILNTALEVRKVGCEAVKDQAQIDA